MPTINTLPVDPFGLIVKSPPVLNNWVAVRPTTRPVVELITRNAEPAELDTFTDDALIKSAAALVAFKLRTLAVNELAVTSPVYVALPAVKFAEPTEIPIGVSQRLLIYEYNNPKLAPAT